MNEPMEDDLIHFKSKKKVGKKGSFHSLEYVFMFICPCRRFASFTFDVEYSVKDF